MKSLATALAALMLLLLSNSGNAATAESKPAHWPQFRGPNASGVAADDQPAPVEFGPDKNLLWKVALPAGHSSPCIWDDRIFLTGFRSNELKLETLCLDRASGKVLWRRDTPAHKIEGIEDWPSLNTPATPTPVTDGKSVVAYFGSYALVAYDFAGKMLWETPFPAPESAHGAGTSPIIVRDLVILDLHLTSEPSLVALRLADGSVVWRESKPPHVRGWSTPVVWREADEDLVGILTPGRFGAHRLADGIEKWWVSGLANEPCATPAVGEGHIFFYVSHGMGDNDSVLKVPTFDEMLARYDQNKDERISPNEVPEDLLLVDRGYVGTGIKSGKYSIKQVISWVPKGQDTNLDRAAWTQKMDSFARFVHNVTSDEPRAVGVRCGGNGDVSGSHIVWSETKGLPQVASELLYRNRLYFVKNDGFVTCREPATGKLIYQERLGAAGGYYASPIASGGRIYTASDRGIVTVFTAGDTITVLARNNLGEAIAATPAIVEGKLYVRTSEHLFAFAETSARSTK
jgi:outer membrane protein assembly factor BamB